jgi:hypothetical protein
MGATNGQPVPAALCCTGCAPLCVWVKVDSLSRGVFVVCDILDPSRDATDGFDTSSKGGTVTFFFLLMLRGPCVFRFLTWAQPGVVVLYCTHITTN